MKQTKTKFRGINPHFSADRERIILDKYARRHLKIEEIYLPKDIRNNYHIEMVYGEPTLIKNTIN